MADPTAVAVPVSAAIPPLPVVIEAEVAASPAVGVNDTVLSQVDVPLMPRSQDVFDPMAYGGVALVPCPAAASVG